MSEKFVVEKISVDQVPQFVRILEYVVGRFLTLNSKSSCKKAIERGHILLNGKRAYLGDYVKVGDSIELIESEVDNQISLKLDILFEDDYLAVVSKPSGILVSGNRKYTLANALSSNITRSCLTDSLSKPEPAHRLDFQTSGVLVIGKTAQSLTLLNKMFENRDVHKKYLAVTIRKMAESGTINSLLDGKECVTTFKVLKTKESRKYDYLNMVEASPLTGRTHQIRRHFASIGNPIFGDCQYGIDGLMPKGRGLLLHAWSIEFTHPFTSEKILVQSEIPHKFLREFERSY